MLQKHLSLLILFSKVAGDVPHWWSACLPYKALTSIPSRKKEKEKKKKIPAATFPPCPIGTVKTGSVGLLGGWLRAGTLSGKSGGVPWQALRQALFGLLPSPHFFPPSSDPPEVAFPCPQALGLTGLYTEAQLGVLHSPGEGGRWDPGSLHTISSVLPQSWALPSMSCCGDMVPLLRSLCHLQAG